MYKIISFIILCSCCLKILKGVYKMIDDTVVKHSLCDFCIECLNHDSCTDKGCLKYCDKTYSCDVHCQNNPCDYYIGGGYNA